MSDADGSPADGVDESPVIDADESPVVATVGAATVDRHYAVSNLPAPDGGAFAETVTERFGGVAANVACAVSALGHEAGVVTRLGTDELGDAVATDLREGPLDTTRVRRGEADEVSTHCVILVDDDGTRSIVTAGESVRRLRLDESDRAYLAASEVVFVTAYAPDTVQQSLAAWSESSSFPPVVFDLSGPLSELEGRGATPASIDRWVDRAALFVVGDVAADSYLDATGRDAADRLADRGVTRAAVTSGPDGATLVTRDDEVVGVPARDVEVVDETGAGDAYVGGLIHAWLLAGRSPAVAGRVAACVAAENCTAAGARGAHPSRDRAAALLDGWDATDGRDPADR
ncbi:carbohydrate kinase family protein [Halobaculum sp. MBLA0147]|uniref:carbohydrate kinase family protein n=1 Tax=Halobaculum sp. MBLA0147 TaxID=3079934 RepID=UPI003526B4C5